MRKEWAILLAALLVMLGVGGQGAMADDGEDFAIDDDDDDDFGFGDDMFGGADGMPPAGEVPPPLEAEPEPKIQELPPKPYTAPSADGLVFLETFDGDWSKRWIPSANTETFTGEWRQMLREKESLTGDYGLRVENEARRHAIASRMPRVEIGDKEFVFSYEVKFEKELQCGGAYVKLFDSSSMGSIAEFDNNTPYVIMFGPDRCGSTNKVHFIMRHYNPISKEWEEKHMVPVVKVPRDTETHVYTLRILPNDTFEIYVDENMEKSGSLHSDFAPPFTNEKQIDDPTDTQPEDWVTMEKIVDPEAVKPDDWDEDAPLMITDADDQMPDDWLVDEPSKVSDPAAVKPAEWDDEEDGTWQAPQIANPRCTEVSGCGPWTAKTKRNPEYKGKWKAPMIANPEYKGPWVPRKIANPSYYEEKHPHQLPAFDAVGFELWTMQAHILFDNVATALSYPPIQRLIGSSWKLRHDIEASRAPLKSSKPVPATIPLQKRLLAELMQVTQRYGAAVYGGAGGLVVLIVVVLLRVCRRAPATSVPKPQGPPVAAPVGGSSEEEQNKGEENRGQEKKALRKCAAKPSAAD